MDRSSLDRSHRPAKAGGHLWRTSSPTPDQSRGSCSKLLRAVSTQDLSISMDGEYTAFLGNLIQCLNTPQKSFFLYSNGYFCGCFSCAQLVLSLDTNEKSLASSSFDSQYTGNQIKLNNLSLYVGMFWFVLVINN